MSRAYGKLIKYLYNLLIINYRLMWNESGHSKIYPVRFCKVIEKYGKHFVNGA